jgi:NADH:ubiquinone oxidoreductase subunit 6 (subunit J)
MLEQLQWFLAVVLVIAVAVAIGAVFWFVIDLATGGVKRAATRRRCAMPARIANLTKGS